MGGGFGGKETQAALFAGVAALARAAAQAAGKLRLDRDDDFDHRQAPRLLLSTTRSASTTTAASWRSRSMLRARCGYSADLSAG